MSRFTAPMLGCDGEDGFCNNQEPDYYEQTVSSIDGVPVTATERAPGWLSTGDEDYCPDCAKRVKQELAEREDERRRERLEDFLREHDIAADDLIATRTGLALATRAFDENGYSRALTERMEEEGR